MTKEWLIIAEEGKKAAFAWRWRTLPVPLRLCGVAVMIGTVLLGLGSRTVRDPLLDRAVRFLVDSDQPEKADLIYVLGGNYLVRAPAAAALFRQGWASRVLLAREPDSANHGQNFTDVTQAILIKDGVPARSITELSPGRGVRSTADEARVLRLYLEAYPQSRVLVVTSAFHTRRARLAMRRAIPNGVRVIVVGVNEPDCTIDTWRRTHACREEVESEWKKFVFYFCTFLG